MQRTILILYILGILLCDFLLGQGPWHSGEKQRQDVRVSSHWAYADTLRDGCAAMLFRAGLDSTTVGLAQGVLMGDKQYISLEQRQEMRAAGMSHLLAVSGLHTGIIWALLSLLLRPLVLIDRRGWHRWIILLLLWGYIAVVGFPLSAIRAGIMISMVQISYALERDVWGWHNLTSAALLILLFSPSQLYEVGFQLSFLATAGILFVSPWLSWSREAFRSVFSWHRFLLVFRQLLFVSLAAQLFTMPLVAYYFHTIPLFGWLQGLLVLPVMALFVYLLLLLLLLTSVGLPTIPLTWCVELLGRWVHLVARYTGSLETYCLGGRLLWYPSLLETLLMLSVLVVLSIFVRRYFSPIGR